MAGEQCGRKRRSGLGKRWYCLPASMADIPTWITILPHKIRSQMTKTRTLLPTGLCWSRGQWTRDCGTGQRLHVGDSPRGTKQRSSAHCCFCQSRIAYIIASGPNCFDGVEGGRMAGSGFGILVTGELLAEQGIKASLSSVTVSNYDRVV